MPDNTQEPHISRDVLAATFYGLTALMEMYKVSSEEWASLCEARRLVECEVAHRGYTPLGEDDEQQGVED